MTSRLLSLLIWALVAASAVAWGLKLLTRPAAVPANATTAQTTAPAMGPIERLLGRPVAPAQADVPPPPAAESRFKLLGVVAARSPREAGWALIAVDGQAPRAVALGQEVEPGLRLLSVAHRRIELGAGAGASVLALELPLLPEAARGRPGDGAAAEAPPAPEQGAKRAAPTSPTAVLSAPVRIAAPVAAPMNAGVPAGPDAASAQPRIGATAAGSMPPTSPYTSPHQPMQSSAQLASQFAAQRAAQQAALLAQQAQQAQQVMEQQAAGTGTTEQPGQPGETPPAPTPIRRGPTVPPLVR